MQRIWVKDDSEQDQTIITIFGNMDNDKQNDEKKMQALRVGAFEE